ncbi:MFS transporter [Mycobacterium sp.]|uniref:MFS transporter n=1 Tax=Mycobacterium sp. TaxID=1785 RepID=UPI003BAA02DB
MVSATFVGNFVEWFDYAAYGYLSATVSRVFFPGSDQTTGLILTYAIFLISFVVRPVGSVFWGYIGDKFGRRAALSLSILVMSLATFCISFLPSYAVVGVFAPVLLFIVRAVQGFSASGEYAGASSFLAEYAPQGAASRCRCKRQGQFRSAVSIRASGSAAGRFAGWGLYGPVVVRAPAMFGL